MIGVQAQPGYIKRMHYLIISLLVAMTLAVSGSGVRSPSSPFDLKSNISDLERRFGKPGRLFLCGRRCLNCVWAATHPRPPHGGGSGIWGLVLRQASDAGPPALQLTSGHPMVFPPAQGGLLAGSTQRTFAAHKPFPECYSNFNFIRMRKASGWVAAMTGNQIFALFLVKIPSECPKHMLCNFAANALPGSLASSQEMERSARRLQTGKAYGLRPIAPLRNKTAGDQRETRRH